MPIDRDVVGRIGEDQVCPFGSHQPFEHVVVSGVAADQTMAIEAPYIAWPGDSASRITGTDWDLVLGFRLGWTVRCALARFVDHDVDLGRRETRDLDVEIKGDEALKLDCQQLLVPASIERELVVDEHIGAPLSRIEMSEAHSRDVLQADQLCSLDSAVTGDDLAILADQYRVGKSEPPDAVCDLPDLLLGMGAGIAPIGPQARHRHRFDGHGPDGTGRRGSRGGGCRAQPLRRGRRARRRRVWCARLWTLFVCVGAHATPPFCHRTAPAGGMHEATCLAPYKPRTVDNIGG